MFVGSEAGRINQIQINDLGSKYLGFLLRIEGLPESVHRLDF